MALINPNTGQKQQVSLGSTTNPNAAKNPVSSKATQTNPAARAPSSLTPKINTQPQNTLGGLGATTHPTTTPTQSVTPKPVATPSVGKQQVVPYGYTSPSAPAVTPKPVQANPVPTVTAKPTTPTTTTPTAPVASTTPQTPQTPAATAPTTDWTTYLNQILAQEQQAQTASQQQAQEQIEAMQQQYEQELQQMESQTDQSPIISMANGSGPLSGTDLQTATNYLNQIAQEYESLQGSGDQSQLTQLYQIYQNLLGRIYQTMYGIQMPGFTPTQIQDQALPTAPATNIATVPVGAYDTSSSNNQAAS